MTTEEKRVDPATKEVYTLAELRKKYSGTYKKKEIEAYWEDECKPVKTRARKPKADAEAKPEPKAKAKAKAKAKPAAEEEDAKPTKTRVKKTKADASVEAKAEPKAKAKAKAKAKPVAAEDADVKVSGGYRTGKDGGASALAKLKSYSKCVLAEYVWLDAKQVPRSKTTTLTARPTKVSDLKVWNYDGSSTGQADGHNSEINLKPRAIFNDPFRGFPHVIVLADAYNAWDDQPAIGNTRAAAAELFTQYKHLDPWFGLEQEYTLMRPGRIGEDATQPLGFNADGTEPAPQGPYYTGAGTGVAMGRPVADEHYKKCLEAGVKVSGINSEVMPGQWEYQVGPCRGIEVGDHLTIARYIMLRVTESHNVVCSLAPKPKETGDWNGAGCHTNFSVAPFRKEGGYQAILKVCEAFGQHVKEHIAEYGEGNEKRLTGKHETCDINTFKWGVADRGASIRIPREAEKTGKGYMEDRRPAANCDPYRVTARIIKTAGAVFDAEKKAAEEAAAAAAAAAPAEEKKERASSHVVFPHCLGP